MLKKLSFLILAILVVSCGGNKPVARNTSYKKPRTGVVTTRKPVAKRPVAVTTKRPPVKKPSPQTADIKKINQQYEGAKEESKSTPNETVYSKQEILEATTRVKVTTAMVLDYIAQ